ncbi:MAG: type II toxin-antitoxin system VapC family toxin [Anaerolineae bacterium]|nr:type II toxin-antitoxin system VapC family toxin [Anaerolineae bacterium]
MTTFFVDTSALGRRYLPEIGSAWVTSWIVPAATNIVVISDLTTVEMLAVFARLQRERKLTTSDAAILQNNFLLHVQTEFLIVSLDQSVILQARALVAKYPLRTLDAIQLACALDAVAMLNEPLTFISGDNVLLAAAGAEGFSTDNPYAHP